MNTYLDIRTNETKPRHTSYGAKEFTPPPRTWEVDSDGKLFDALQQAKNSGGGTIVLKEMITVDKTVSFVNNLKVTGGGVRAASNFNGKHLVHFRNGSRNLWVEDVELDANRRDIITFPIMEESRHVTLKNVRAHHGKSGITISNGASNITIYGCESYSHWKWHGIVVQHTDCESVFIGSCHCHDNGAYGLDLHLTHGEIAGCIFEKNGRGDSQYRGVSAKLPESVDLKIHDCTFSNPDGGSALMLVYGNPNASDPQRPTRDISVYRSIFRGPKHYWLDARSTVDEWDNSYQNAGGSSINAVATGDGKLVKDSRLGQLPGGSVVVRPEPEPDPDKSEIEYITKAEAEDIARAVFNELIGNLQVEISYQQALAAMQPNGV